MTTPQPETVEELKTRIKAKYAKTALHLAQTLDTPVGSESYIAAVLASAHLAGMAEGLSEAQRTLTADTRGGGR